MTDDSPSTIDERMRRAFASLDDADVRLERPPEGLWDAIADAIADLDGEGQPVRGATPETASGTPVTTPAALGTVTPIPRSRAVVRGIIGVAAAVAVLAVAAVSTGVLGQQAAPSIIVDGPVDKPTEVIPLAVAQLDPLEPGVQPATAELLDAATIVLQPDLVAQDDAFYEVWLLDEAAQALVSLGPLREDGQYTIPDGVTTQSFPIVDVSIEAPDGNPAHSGRSVLRGTLT